MKKNRIGIRATDERLAPRRTIAGAAEAVQDQFVVLQAKAAGRQTPEVPRAAVDVEDLLARPAAEVVMMALAADLVSGRLAGDLHRRDVAAPQQVLQRAIDRGDAQPAGRRSGGAKHFLRIQGPASLPERLSDRLSLRRVSLDRHFSRALGLIK